MPGTPPFRHAERKVLSVLRRYGELTRSDLARLSGLPRSTVTDCLARLRAAGVVSERAGRGEEGPRTGRPPRLVALMPRTGLLGAAVLTNGVLHAALLGFDAGLVAGPLRCDLPEIPAGVVGPAHDLLARLLQEAGAGPGDLACAVLGVPAPIDPVTGRIQFRTRTADQERRRSASRRSLIEEDAAAALSARLGVTVWAENDANLAVLGEASFGAAQGLRDVVLVKALDGMGAAVLLDGRLHRGQHGLAGEIAHLHVWDDGPACVCGGRGCLRTQHEARHLVTLVQPAHEQPLSLRDVLALASDGDAAVTRILGDLGRTIGRPLADLCVFLNPEAVVTDAALGAAGPLILDGMGEALRRFAPPAVADGVRLIPGVLDGTAELWGALAFARARDDLPLL